MGEALVQRTRGARTAPLVLVVDDERGIRETLRGVLEDEGLRVETAADGAEAVESIAESWPDVLLLDLGLPILNGEEVVAELRTRYGRTPPLVIITAAGNTAERSRRLGAEAYLEKPFDLDDVVRLVGVALHRPEAEKPPLTRS